MPRLPVVPLLLVAAASCAPRPARPAPPTGSAVDDPVTTDLRRRDRAPVREPAVAPAPATAQPAAAAGVRGVINRLELVEVLDRGPGRFLVGIEVSPVFRDGRFAGWQIDRFAPEDPRIARAPVSPGDIIASVNALPIAQPGQFQRVWESLREAKELSVRGERQGASFELRYAIASP
jgi:type II secretory pathway component PulC